jgi:hypothetical protein
VQVSAHRTGDTSFRPGAAQSQFCEYSWPGNITRPVTIFGEICVALMEFGKVEFYLTEGEGRWNLFLPKTAFNEQTTLLVLHQLILNLSALGICAA